MLTKTSSCAMRTQSIGKISSSTQGSNLWWCPPTAVSHVSNPNGTHDENEKNYLQKPKKALKIYGYPGKPNKNLNQWKDNIKNNVPVQRFHFMLFLSKA